MVSSQLGAEPNLTGTSCPELRWAARMAKKSLDPSYQVSYFISLVYILNRPGSTKQPDYEPIIWSEYERTSRTTLLTSSQSGQCTFTRLVSTLSVAKCLISHSPVRAPAQSLLTRMSEVRSSVRPSLQGSRTKGLRRCTHTSAATNLQVTCSRY